LIIFVFFVKISNRAEITDGYLWISIVAKPIQSSLTRTDRTTNCFLHH